jgi:hypothetical protein
LPVVNNIFENIDYFSGGDNNNQGNNNGDNNNGDNNNNNNDNNEDSDSNSDDVEMSDTREVPDHNAPEQIMDDLDLVDRARHGDPEALVELKREYPEYFEGKSDIEAVWEIEDYLEAEFPLELKRSELEVEVEEAQDRAVRALRKAEIVERVAEGVTDPIERENLRIHAQDYRKTAEEEIKKAESLDAQAKGRSNNSNNNDGNDSSGGPGPSASGPGPSGSGPSDSGSGSGSGPSGSSGGTLSQIMVILGGFVETIIQVLENLNM